MTILEFRSHQKDRHQKSDGGVPVSPLLDATPVNKDCHPELDTSKFPDNEGMQQHQSMMGLLQWLTSMGRWDIMTSVMSMSSCRAQPRKGHSEVAKCLCACVHKTKHCTLKSRIDQPDMSMFHRASEVSWDKSACGAGAEEIPNNAPESLGESVTLVHHFDANLMHNVTSGKAVTGCLHLANKTPIVWHSKKQATTETATCGAEFVAGRTCMEQNIDLRNAFGHLGVKTNNASCVFGDDESMADSASHAHSRLKKRHNVLSFHCVQSQIACGHINLKHIRSHNNASDILLKHWGHQSVKALLKPFFNTTGNMANLCADDGKDCPDRVAVIQDDQLVPGRIQQC